MVAVGMKLLSRSLAALTLAAVGVGAAPPPRAVAAEPTAIAVVVNPRNPVTDLSLRQLRSYFKLEQQYWPSKERCEVFLRPTRSKEADILLDRVYQMSNEELRKYWVGKIFRGEISSKPSVIPTAKAAGARVGSVTGALTVILADEVPEGVRVLTIDGKKPGDEGYPLVAAAPDDGPDS